jgi:hypothetical protein
MAKKPKKDSIYSKPLKDINKDGNKNFKDTFLGDLIGADGKIGINKGNPGLKASLKGERREKPAAKTTTKAATKKVIPKSTTDKVAALSGASRSVAGKVKTTPVKAKEAVKVAALSGAARSVANKVSSAKAKKAAQVDDNLSAAEIANMLTKGKVPRAKSGPKRPPNGAPQIRQRPIPYTPPSALQTARAANKMSGRGGGGMMNSLYMVEDQGPLGEINPNIRLNNKGGLQKKGYSKGGKVKK